MERDNGCEEVRNHTVGGIVSSEGLNSALVSPAFGTNNAPIPPGGSASASE